MQNKTLTIMFIDVQGYTSLTTQKTRDEQQLFVQEIKSFVDKHLKAKSGKLIKTMGDGFLATFESPTDAISCGKELQKEISRRNTNVLNTENLIAFRIGISTGEVSIDESGDVFGDVVNIAARIQKFAEPNEVFISESTYLAMNSAEIKAQDLGPQNFKNVLRQVRVYKIVMDNALTGALIPKRGDEVKRTHAFILIVITVFSIALAAYFAIKYYDLLEKVKEKKKYMQELMKQPPQMMNQDQPMMERRQQMMDKKQQMMNQKQKMRPEGQQQIQRQQNNRQEYGQQMQSEENRQPMRRQQSQEYGMQQDGQYQMAPGGQQQNQAMQNPCGDGICDQAEQDNPNLCPQDCPNTPPQQN